MQECTLFNNKDFIYFGNPKEINNRFFVSIDKQFIFCENPKTGISTVKKTLAELIENKKINYDVHNRKEFILKSPCFNKLKKEEFDKFLKFTFVRNPYTRILSAYLDKMKKDTVEKQEIYKFANLDLNKKISFVEFLRILEKIKPVNINPHFRPQYINICYPLIKYDFIGRFENFNDDFEKILHQFFDDVKISIVDHHKTKADDRLKEYYDLEAIQLVKRIYARDFIYFDYHFYI